MRDIRLKKWAKFPFVLLATAILLFEEFVWFSLLALMTKIGHLPVFRQIEAWMGGLGKWGSLGLFVLPGVALFPVKIFAMWLMGANHPVLGAVTFVLAKIVGTRSSPASTPSRNPRSCGSNVCGNGATPSSACVKNCTTGSMSSRFTSKPRFS